MGSVLTQARRCEVVDEIKKTIYRKCALNSNMIGLLLT